MNRFFRLAIFINALIFSVSSHAEISTEVICTFAPSQSKVIGSIFEASRNVGKGAEITLLSNGLKILRHSSGAPILSGSNGYIAGTMARALTTSTLIKAGVVVGFTAVTVEFACAPLNHPELVKKIMDEAKEYSEIASETFKKASIKSKEISDSKIEEMTDLIIKYKTITKDKFYELMGETWYEKAIRKTKENLGL